MQTALLFSIGGIASAIATLFLLTSNARPETDLDGLANGRSEAPAGANSPDASASTSTAASPTDAAARATAITGDPAAALRSAAELRAVDERRRAVLLAGRRWAWTDPEAALAMVSTLPSGLRVDYLATVSREWANLDPEAFLRFAESTSDREALIAGLELLIPSEPIRVFGIVGRLAQGAINWAQMQMAVARAMAEQDVMLAVRAHETAPRGTYSQALLNPILVVHGRRDPDAALAWLESQGPVSAATRAAVYRGIAATDFALGYRLLTGEFPVNSLGSTVDRDLAAILAEDTGSTLSVAETLLEIGTERAGQILGEVATVWARRDPARLTDWMIANAAAIEPQLARSIGLGVATSDLESALRLVGELPPAIGDAWVPQIAGTYARQDPRAALDWVARYQGQPFYEEARAQAVLQAVDRNPELIASMLPGLPGALQASVVPNIASAWVQRDPRAAAEWVAGLEGAAAETDAAGRIIAGWMRRDLEAATQWAFGLPRGRMRDDALTGLLEGSYGVNLDPRAIFDEIESAELRRYAATRVVGNRGATDLAYAQDFLESLLDDEELGEWARETLERLATRN